MKRLLFFVGIPLVFLILVFWLIFHSSILANTSFIIPIRNYYFGQLEKYSPFGTLYYSARPIDVRVGDWGTIYHYKFFGHFESIDVRKRTITLKDKDGKEWKFKYTSQMRRKQEFYELFPITEETIERNNEVTHKLGYMVTNMEEPEKTVPYFYKGDWVAIFWADKRSVSEILKAEKNGEVFSMGGTGKTSITRVVKGNNNEN